MFMRISNAQGVSRRSGALIALAGRRGVLLSVILLALVASTVGCGRKSPQQSAMEISNFLRTGQFLKAAIEGNKFLERHPDSDLADEVRLMTAISYDRIYHYEKAYEYLDAVIERRGLEDPLGFEAFAMRLSTMISDEKTTPALELAQARLEEMDAATTRTEAAYDSLRETYASLHMRHGDMQKGRAIFSDMFEATTDVLKASNFTIALATSAVKIDEPELSLQAFSRFMDRFPNVEAQMREDGSEENFIYFIEAIVKALASKEYFDEAIQLYRIYLDKTADTRLERKLKTGIAFYLKEMDQEEEANSQFAEVLGMINDEIQQARTGQAPAQAPDGLTTGTLSTTGTLTTTDTLTTTGAIAAAAPPVESAVERYRQAIVREHAIGTLYFEKTKTYELMGDMGAALSLSREYLDDHTTSTLFNHFLGNVLMVYNSGVHFTESMRQDLEIMTRLANDYLLYAYESLDQQTAAASLEMLLSIYARGGRFDEYEDLTNRLLRDYPDEPLADWARQAADQMEAAQRQKEEYEKWKAARDAEQAEAETMTTGSLESTTGTIALTTGTVGAQDTATTDVAPIVLDEAP